MSIAYRVSTRRVSIHCTFCFRFLLPLAFAIIWGASLGVFKSNTSCPLMVSSVNCFPHLVVVSRVLFHFAGARNVLVSFVVIEATFLIRRKRLAMQILVFSHSAYPERGDSLIKTAWHPLCSRQAENSPWLSCFLVSFAAEGIEYVAMCVRLVSKHPTVCNISEVAKRKVENKEIKRISTDSFHPAEARGQLEAHF